ncbi:redoxin domain-containing protein [Paucisalibacillus sp. EB02]|uniref:redoxin domain-containing protein n=1 Tax=Paucisalibacillus sp. EB02 TaxID=1347087 RepID=UPI0004B12B3A|nr:redoxin domain-containing protein [Paucisalibacillus sp. EB02]
MGKSNIKKIPALFGALLMIFLVVILIQNIGESVADKSKLDKSSNSEAPNFSATALNGDVVNLQDYKGKAVLLNFWASWCYPCRNEMPLIQDSYDSYKDQGLEVLAINFREKEDAIQQYLDENPSFDFPILLDDGTINDQYKVQNLPTTFFVNPDGTIERYYMGELNEESLHVFIQEILESE